MLYYSKKDIHGYFNESYTALIYDEEEEYNELIKGLTNALRKIGSTHGYNNRGVAYSEMGMNDLALADFKRAIELDESNEIPTRNLDRM